VVETNVKAGDVVYFVLRPNRIYDKPDTVGIVQYAFLDDTGETRAVVKYKECSETKYELLHQNRLSLEMGGDTFYDKKMKDPKNVLAMLVDLGIHNPDGTLTISYGGEYTMVNGMKIYDDDDLQ